MVLDRLDQLEATVAQLQRDVTELLGETGITEKRAAERKEAEDAAAAAEADKPEDVPPSEPLGHDPATWSPTATGQAEGFQGPEDPPHYAAAPEPVPVSPVPPSAPPPSPPPAGSPGSGA